MTTYVTRFDSGLANVRPVLFTVTDTRSSNVMTSLLNQSQDVRDSDRVTTCSHVRETQTEHEDVRQL